MSEELEARVARIRSDMDAADESLRALEASLGEKFVPREEIYSLFRNASEETNTGLRRNMFLTIIGNLMLAAILVLCILRFSNPIPTWPKDFPMCVKVAPTPASPQEAQPASKGAEK